MDKNTNSSYWFDKEKDLLHTSLHSYINQLDTLNDEISQRHLIHLHLYGAMEAGSGNIGSPFLGKGYDNNQSNFNLTFNICQSMVDTAVAKIGAQKPRAAFQTQGGNWKQKKKASMAENAVQTVMYSSEFYSKAEMCLKQACILGTGYIKWFYEKKRKGKTEKTAINCEYVLADEIKFNYADAATGNPSEMHQVKLVNKEVLKKNYPKFCEEIETAASSDVYGIYKYEDANMVKVVESWRLPDLNHEEGLHCITISNATLVCEDWNKDYFPFTIIRWNKRPYGFSGQGICEQLFSIQYDINVTLKAIQKCIYYGSTPKLFVEYSSKVNLAHLNNEIAGVIKYAGTKPEMRELMRVPPELWTHLNMLYAKAYEIIGISQLSASAKNPMAGETSAAALREFNYVESARFQSQGKEYEKFFMDASKIIVNMLNELTGAPEEGGLGESYKFKGFDKVIFKNFKWEKLDLEEEALVIKVWSSALTNLEPAGRLGKIQEYINSGLMSRSMAIQLLDMPDLQDAFETELADWKSLELAVYRMSEGEAVLPEVYQNLTDEAVMFVTKEYLRAQAEGLEEEYLELFRNWIDRAKEIVEQARAQMLAQQQQAAAIAMAQQQQGAVMQPGQQNLNNIAKV